MLQLPTAKRRELLRRLRGFECACSRCKREEVEQDELQRSMPPALQRLTPSVPPPRSVSGCKACGGPLSSYWTFDVGIVTNGSCTEARAHNVGCAYIDPSRLLVWSELDLT